MVLSQNSQQINDYVISLEKNPSYTNLNTMTLIHLQPVRNVQTYYGKSLLKKKKKRYCKATRWRVPLHRPRGLGIPVHHSSFSPPAPSHSQLWKGHAAELQSSTHSEIFNFHPAFWSAVSHKCSVGDNTSDNLGGQGSWEGCWQHASPQETATKLREISQLRKNFREHVAGTVFTHHTFPRWQFWK